MVRPMSHIKDYGTFRRMLLRACARHIPMAEKGSEHVRVCHALAHLLQPSACDLYTIIMWQISKYVSSEKKSRKCENRKIEVKEAPTKKGLL